MTLLPGDIVATGTPAGVGVFRDPPVFLRDGQTVTVWIDKLGRLTNPVRAEPSVS
jgi:2-keto-4-pentenoate hydratase/2-oxohepta-3-ene-1,7-dioic acid hydratase in catechol pathway